MTGGVRIGIQADKTVLAAMDDVSCALGFLGGHAMSNGIVGGSQHVAEYTVFIFGGWPFGELRGHAGPGLGVTAGDVGIAPGSPEMVHRSGRSGQEIRYAEYSRWRWVDIRRRPPSG